MRGLVVLCASVTTLVTPAKAHVSDALRTAIVEAEESWRQARIDGDVAFLQRFYAKEARIQEMNGKSPAREADIAMFKTGQIKSKFITHGPLNIQTYGDLAIVTGVDHLGRTAFGRYGEMFLRFTDVLLGETGADN